MIGLSRAGHIHVWVVLLSVRLRVGALLRGLSRAERRMARTFGSGHRTADQAFHSQIMHNL